MIFSQMKLVEKRGNDFYINTVWPEVKVNKFHSQQGENVLKLCMAANVMRVYPGREIPA